MTAARVPHVPHGVVIFVLGLMDSFGPHPASVGNSLEIVHQSGSGGPDMNIGEFVGAFMGRGQRPHYQGEPLYIFQRGVVGDDLLTPTVDGLFSPEHQHVNMCAPLSPGCPLALDCPPLSVCV